MAMWPTQGGEGVGGAVAVCDLWAMHSVKQLLRWLVITPFRCNLRCVLLHDRLGANNALPPAEGRRRRSGAAACTAAARQVGCRTPGAAVPATQPRAPKTLLQVAREVSNYLRPCSRAPFERPTPHVLQSHSARRPLAAVCPLHLERQLDVELFAPYRQHGSQGAACAAANRSGGRHARAGVRHRPHRAGVRRLQAAGERPGSSRGLRIVSLAVSTAGSAPWRSRARPQRRVGACCTLCSAQRCCSPPPMLLSPSLTQAATAAADVDAICKVGLIALLGLNS